MAFDLDVELRLEERLDDSVIVSVLLAPRGGSATVDGVALRLRDNRGRGIGPRVLLPIAGTIHQSMRTTVALEAESDELPMGAMVQVVAWREQEQREASIPTDPMTALEVHVRGTTPWPEDDDGDRFLERLLPEERAMWARHYPWIDDPRVPREDRAALDVVDSEQSDDDAVDAFAEEMGLDDESAEWLKDLLAEED